MGVTYYYTMNPGLTFVNEQVLGNADSHSLVLGYAGVGFGFSRDVKVIVLKPQRAERAQRRRNRFCVFV